MNDQWRRRDVLLGLGATFAIACTQRASASPPRSEGVDPFAGIEASVGGRVGVFVLDTGSGATLAHRADERFAMCSTFKWALAAAILERVDRAEIALEERLPYGPSDLVDNATTTRAHVSEGGMTVEDLARATIANSDNTAANLLLGKVGGPPGLTRFFRRAGDPITRVDRTEPQLNSNVRGDVHDTTSPRAMVGLMQSVLCGGVLSAESRARLIRWLSACETGRERLRAGLPANWMVGDKTGTGDGGAANDVAIAIPPGRAPILIASYLSDSASPLAALSAAHAAIGRIAAQHL